MNATRLTRLFSIVTSLSLSEQRSLARLVLRHLVRLMLLAFLAFAISPSRLGNVDHLIAVHHADERDRGTGRGRERERKKKEKVSVPFCVHECALDSSSPAARSIPSYRMRTRSAQYLAHEHGQQSIIISIRWCVSVLCGDIGAMCRRCSMAMKDCRRIVACERRTAPCVD